ncbi:MAG: hypothetical protein VX908_02210 [Planctomycetota bacterium]|nr:hypothetical protein [Planctomycetota bacterium]
MGRRNSRPTLLELFKTKSQGEDDHPSHPSLHMASEQQAWWTPGRSLRLTLGHLLIAGGVVILLMVAVWMLAYRQGELRARADLESAIFHPVGIDPMVSSPGNVEVDEPDAPVLEEDSAGENRNIGENFIGDPREDSLFYFVLAETRPDGAMRLAEFCRGEGLEAWVIPRDNGGLARVIVLPGLETASRIDPGVRDLDDRIGSIGRQWKSIGGRSSLEDRYLIRGDS